MQVPHRPNDWSTVPWDPSLPYPSHPGCASSHHPARTAQPYFKSNVNVQPHACILAPAFPPLSGANHSIDDSLFASADLLVVIHPARGIRSSAIVVARRTTRTSTSIPIHIPTSTSTSTSKAGSQLEPSLVRTAFRRKHIQSLHPCRPRRRSLPRLVLSAHWHRRIRLPIQPTPGRHSKKPLPLLNHQPVRNLAHSDARYPFC